MKERIKQIALSVAKCGLRLIYGIFRPFKRRNKVVMLSRQSDSVPIDFKLIEQSLAIKSPDTEVVAFCRKMTKNVNILSYSMLIFKSLYHVATARVAITDTYSIQLCVLPHDDNLKIIQVWHALGAIKKFSYQCLDTPNGHSSQMAKNMCMHKNYDYILCTSEATKSIYSEAFNCEADKILVLGMPRVDYIREPVKNIRAKYLAARPDLKDKKIVLYLPTFREGVERGVENLLKSAVGNDSIKILVKPHPLSNFEVPQENVTERGWSTYDLMKLCDCIVTDYSASALEASVIRKPVYFYLYDYEEYKSNQGLNVDPYIEMPNMTAFNADELIEKICSGGYDYTSYYAFRSKYIETADENNTERITDFILQFLK